MGRNKKSCHTNNHPEPLLESCNHAGCCSVDVLRDIVHRHATVTRLKIHVALLRHALKGPILRTEEKSCGPIVTEVFGKGARGACSGVGRRNVGVHGDVEGIATDDLMYVWRLRDSRIYEGIKAFDDELGAGEAEESVCGGREETKEEWLEQHDG